MDVAGYLLGSGFGLLIVLLGWANQITSKNKQTKDLESQFLKKARVRQEDYRRMVDEGGATEESLDSLIQFLFTKEEGDLEAFSRIQAVKKKIDTLDRKYSQRFWLLTSLSILLFGSGIGALLTPREYNLWMLSPSLVLIAFVFVNLVAVYNIEKKYTKDLNEVMGIL